MIDNMIGSDDIGADIFDDGDEDEMHEAVGAALAARASHTDNHPLRAAQKAAEYAKKLGTSHRTIDFEMVIPPHTKTNVTRYPRILFRGQKVTVNTTRGTRRTKGDGLHVRELFVGGKSQRRTNAGDIYSSEVRMDTAWPNTPIMFLVENTSSEPKTFKAEIYGIVLEGAKPADHTRASASRVIGADMPQALSPTELTAKYNVEVAKLKAAEPNFWQRPVLGKFNGTQVVVGGAGLALILGGIATLIVRKK
jgi:hypothetical protein